LLRNPTSPRKRGEVTELVRRPIQLNRIMILFAGPRQRIPSLAYDDMVWRETRLMPIQHRNVSHLDISGEKLGIEQRLDHVRPITPDLSA